MKLIKINKIITQWLATVDEGKRLELIAADDHGKEITEGITYPLATIIADGKDETLLIEIYSEEGIVQLPISELQRVLNLASGEVHSEHWYEEHSYKEIANGNETKDENGNMQQ